MMLALTTAPAVNATTINFSFYDDAADYMFNRTHVGGSVTGYMTGLASNGTGLLPTSIVITSDVSFLNMTDTLIDSSDALWFWNNSGFTLVNDVITSGGFGLNFMDPTAGWLQFRLNSQDSLNMNVLHWNGGDAPHVGIGNTDGLAGVTFSPDSIAPIPEPSTFLLLGAGLAGIGIIRRRAKK